MSDIIRVTNLTKDFGKGFKAVDGLSFTVASGQVYGFLGQNGAGKSTLVKVLREELKPQKGKVSKHPNLRIGYVAQHAFDKIDDHLEETPIQYIRSRYANGNDSEASQLSARDISDEEQVLMDQRRFPTGGNERQRKANPMGQFEKIVGRVQESRKYKYQIKFQGMDSRDIRRRFGRGVPGAL